MESLLTNKRFIKAVTGLAGALTLFSLMLFINEIKSNRYIGHAQVQPATISVTGKGEVTAVPDIATLYLNLSKDGSTAKEAQDLLNQQVTKTLAYLKGQKIDDKDIKSEYGGVNPKYEPMTPINCFAYPCSQPESKIVGYTANQSITVKVRASDTANEIRTGLANLGVNNISGPTFSIDDEDSLNNEARSKAIADARAKAKILARELHANLGDIVSFSENGGGYPMMYAAKDMAMTASAPSAPAPELPKGENKITANVTITYEIR